MIIFRSAGRMVPVASIQLCHRSMKAAADNMQMNEHSRVPIHFIMNNEI